LLFAPIKIGAISRMPATAVIQRRVSRMFWVSHTVLDTSGPGRLCPRRSRT
jgi:hypothetical protein